MAHADHDDAPMAHRVADLVAELEQRGITSDAELTDVIEKLLTGASPLNGAKLVARSWVDVGFRERLLADANAAIAEFGMDLAHWAHVKLVAVENTASVHNVIVCTLCSCYPIALLGPPPTWYKSEAYRSRVVREPRAVLAEFGVQLGKETTVNVWDSTAELRYLVIPRRPSNAHTLSESELAALVPRDALIGVALAAEPYEFAPRS